MSKGMPDGLKSALYWVVGLASIALILLIMLIIFGNLSGNVGFAANTAGYNNTENVINNFTLASTNISSNFPTVGTILGVAILLVILLGVLIYAISKMMKVAGAGGGSNASFG